MVIRNFPKISALFLMAVFCAWLVACNSGGKSTSETTLSPISGDAAETGPTITASATPTSVPTSTPTTTPSITPTKTATPLPVENQIAFFASKNNKGTIYRMNPDGSGLTRLVNVELLGVSYYPSLLGISSDTFSWSPDGAWIVYASTEDGDSDLYAIDVEGTTKIKLTDSPEDEWGPSWSPDGRYIAYGIQNTAHVLDLNTMEAKQILEISNSQWLGQFTWSPDSEILTYTAVGKDSYTTWEIFGHLANEGFGSVGPIVYHQGFKVGFLNWSPRGDSFVYSSEIKSYGDIGLYITASDPGNEPRLLTVSTNFFFDTDWSPDGTTLVYTIPDEDSPWDIYRIDPDGENQTRLTENLSGNKSMGYRSPVWSPDGSKIAFLSESDPAKYEIFIMNPDGSEQTNLTNDPDLTKIRRWHPQWQPLRIPMNIPLSTMAGEPIREAAEIEISIPGRAIDDLVLNLEENGFECKSRFEVIHSTSCNRSAGTLDYSVKISSQSLDQFDRIEANIRESSDTVTEQSFSDFLGYTVTLAFLGQPELQELAKEELVNYFDNHGAGWTLDTAYGDLDLTIQHLTEETLYIWINRVER